MPPPTKVVLDPTAAYPEMAVLRTALAARDWPACRALLDAAEPMLRTALIRHAGEQTDIEPFLRSVLSSDPADGTASAMLGNHLIDVGWKIRTEKRAKYVSQERFTLFREWLCRAEQVLIDGAMYNPKDPAIWAARLTTARGLGLGLAETQRRYDRMLAAHPGHLPGQLHMLQSLCPKWNGTWEMLHEFARQATDAEPPGSPHAVLITEAHLEHALDFGTVPDMVSYLSHSSVRMEIRQAARDSIEHPDFTRGYGRLTALNNFAACFTLLGDQDAAAAAFAQMGDLAEKHPWTYLGDDPVAEIRKARAWASGGNR